MALDRHNILTAQDPVDLAPLANSHEADESERELKLLFKAMFDAYVRPAEQNTRTLGMPQVGSNDQFERAVKQDGIALYRREDLASTEAMRYVYAAWRAGNPKRGLGMLKAYMQLQWPNAWDCVQMWQSKSRTYPNGLIEADDGNAFLTSRVDISLSADGLGSANINQIGPALRSVIPARMMLSIASKSLYSTEIFTAAAATGLEVQYFEGTATSVEAPPVTQFTSWVADTGSASIEATPAPSSSTIYYRNEGVAEGPGMYTTSNVLIPGREFIWARSNWAVGLPWPGNYLRLAQTISVETTAGVTDQFTMFSDGADDGYQLQWVPLGTPGTHRLRLYRLNGGNLTQIAESSLFSIGVGPHHIEVIDDGVLCRFVIDGLNAGSSASVITPGFPSGNVVMAFTASAGALSRLTYGGVFGA